jgi:hypothetical protein
MGLDLTLIAISNKASFIIDKARQSNYYAADIDKVHNTYKLKENLKMVRANQNEEAFENSLAELIKDSEFLMGLYPGGRHENYVFASETRGYATINYLLQRYLQDNHRKEEFNKDIFYEGIDIDFAKQHTRLHYIDNSKVEGLSDLLNAFEFEKILSYYDYDKMTNVVYKLTGPENLGGLREEFKSLQAFYLSAKTLGAFVLAKIS